jgi:hypothetical protein
MQAFHGGDQTIDRQVSPGSAECLQGDLCHRYAGLANVVDVDVLRPKDHSFCQSIYFFDPNGIRLKMTARTEAPGELDRVEQAAEGQLAAWNARKQRKYGVPA